MDLRKQRNTDAEETQFVSASEIAAKRSTDQLDTQQLDAVQTEYRDRNPYRREKQELHGTPMTPEQEAASYREQTYNSSYSNASQQPYNNGYGNAPQQPYNNSYRNAPQQPHYNTYNNNAPRQNYAGGQQHSGSSYRGTATTASPRPQRQQAAPPPQKPPKRPVNSWLCSAAAV